MEEKRKETRLVIDSTIFIDYLRDYEPAVDFFNSLSLNNYRDVLFSAVTETELIAGKSCTNPEIRNQIILMLNSFIKIDVTNPIALLAGDIRRENQVLTPDALIAATAIINKVELLTRNVKDFEKIKNLKVRSP